MNSTGMLFVLCLFVGLCVFLSGLCLLLYFRQRTAVAALQGEMAVLKRRTQERAEWGRAGQEAAAQGRRPQDSSRMQARFDNPEGLNGRVPEKYGYVAQLERSGLGAEEIADILEVSQNEAEQMLSLARASRMA